MVDSGFHAVTGAEALPTVLRVWGELEQAFLDGLVVNLAVRDMDVQSLEGLLSGCQFPPVANEVSPELGAKRAEALIEWSTDQGIRTIAHGPAGEGELNTQRVQQALGASKINWIARLTDVVVCRNLVHEHRLVVGYEKAL